MSSILKKALSVIPVMTILGWIFPDLVKAFEDWQANKTPENVVKLGETAANTLAAEFDPSLLPELQADEHIADPAITAILSAAEEPSVSSVELALLETSMSGIAILNKHGILKRDIPEEHIKDALIPLFTLLKDAGLE